MCGIIGIISTKDVTHSLIEALKRLEYRGYDSAGIAVLQDGHIQRRRAQGKLVNLEEKIKAEPLSGTIGIGHTRWATHGVPSEANAHPHATEDVVVVHNGIIENHQDLKDELLAAGHTFKSETDTEVIAHLITFYLKKGQPPQEAAFTAFAQLKGAGAILVQFREEDNLLIGLRQGTPMAVGYGEGEMYLASDSYALAPMTKNICFLEDGDRAVMTREGVRLFDKDETLIERPVRVTAQSGAATGKGEYKHFMLKEIHEQPAVIGDTLNSFINPTTGVVTLPGDILEALAGAPRLTLIACGTAFYTCMVAKYWFEKYCGIPVEVDIASEFRYREGPLPESGVAIFVSQSGETLDTLEALRHCKRGGQKILSIVNTIESTIERESDFVLHTLAGPEIAVASTKATTTQLTTLACMAIAMAQQKKTLEADMLAAITDALRHIPMQVATLLAECEKNVQQIAYTLKDSIHMLYMARGALHPIALEGALKMKELSYIHAEGYAAGEFKHGPIALVDNAMPLVVLAPANDPLFEKTLSNVQETVARGGQIIALSDKEGLEKLNSLSKYSVRLGHVHPFVAPVLYTIPVQLLSYYTAVAKGTDVDQPRNLAKSVTVE